MIAHRFLNPDTAVDELLDRAPWLVSAIDDAAHSTGVALVEFSTQRRKQALADMFRLFLSARLEGLVDSGATVEVATRNSVRVVLDEGRVRIRILRQPRRGFGLTAKSRARRAECKQEQLSLLTVEDLVPDEVNLFVLWDITATGVTMSLVLPSSVRERTRYVDQHWERALPAPSFAASTSQAGVAGGESDLDEYIRRAGEVGDSGDDQGPDEPA